MFGSESSNAHDPTFGVSDVPAQASQWTLDEPTDFHIPIPGEPAIALELSDTWDGTLNTLGFGINFDKERIQDDLDPLSLVLLEQVDTVYFRDENPYIKTQIVLLESKQSKVAQLQHSEEQANILHDIKKDLVPNGLGGKDEFAIVNKANDFTQLGAGVIEHGSGQTELRYTKYTFGKDGTVEITDSKIATATVIPNVACPAVPNPITSDALLSSKQTAFVCDLFGQYDDILPDDYTVTLNSGATDFDDRNSVSWGAKSILLTYPYLHGEELSQTDVHRTALHEILHATYRDLPADSPVFKDTQNAYDTIMSALRNPLESEAFQEEDSPLMSEPVWATITEATYISPDSTIGHPWDNATEMLSSLGAVIKDYSDPFIQQFNTLQKNEQLAILQAIYSLDAMLAAHGTSGADIIPNFSDTRTALELIAQAG